MPPKTTTPHNAASYPHKNPTGDDSAPENIETFLTNLDEVLMSQAIDPIQACKITKEIREIFTKHQPKVGLCKQVIGDIYAGAPAQNIPKLLANDQTSNFDDRNSIRYLILTVAALLIFIVGEFIWLTQTHP